ncbi:hypothetical protein A4A49_58523 [Nicotiana attenuata]|uniref:Uncharacterized protein n=1 Tax=Nicotiana attenuata TaxID=49451 RepID=A0A1J6HSX9_NICAT|nr:hypothetical protein A4A49_58523 [Nicotiana attenuata]
MMLSSQPKFSVATKMACCRKRNISQVSDFDDMLLEKDEKQLRAMMLKNRFANIIFKSEQQLLGKDFDEQLLMKQKVQLREEIKKAELKKQRQREREAARIAIESIKRTVNFDDGLNAERELLMLIRAA